MHHRLIKLALQRARYMIMHSILSAIAGNDIKIQQRITVEKKDYTQALNGILTRGFRIGVIDNALNAEGVDAQLS